MNAGFQNRHDRGGRPSGKAPKLIIVFLILFILAIIIYWASGGDISIETSQEEGLAVREQPVPGPQIRHPIPEYLAENSSKVNIDETDGNIFSKPIPDLDESDSAIRNALERLTGNSGLIGLLSPQNFIRKFVITVDNLPGKRIPQQYLPVKRPGSRFKVLEDNAEITLDQGNYTRYSQTIELLDVLDSEAIVTLYVYLYPLFQEAYEELGYHERYFNDQMIAAIDDLLATPQIDGPVRLIHPNAFYQFSDPDLEALSAGQKLLLRMGARNASRVKHKLQKIRLLISANN